MRKVTNTNNGAILALRISLDDDQNTSADEKQMPVTFKPREDRLDLANHFLNNSSLVLLLDR